MLKFGFKCFKNINRYNIIITVLLILHKTLWACHLLYSYVFASDNLLLSSMLYAIKIFRFTRFNVEINKKISRNEFIFFSYSP